MRRLVVAPHGDDEVMGCGGLLAKYPDECVVLVCAHMEPDRRHEFDAARKVLGYSEVGLVEFQDGAIGNDMAELVTCLDDVFAAVKPDEVYLPYPDMHQDHIAAYEAGMRASRLSSTLGHWSPNSVLIYDVASYDLELYPTALRWNVFQSLTEAQVDAKHEAVHAYDSQLLPGAHPMNGVKELARATGVARGVDFAEQYALVRSVRE